jgi:threonine/homoserine/homoserine lactone efflux protein
MSVGFLLKGIILGFSIAAPVGPIGILCIRRTLAYGRKAGFVTGLGAATADAFYGSIAGFGLTAISNFLISGKFWLGLIGGLFLLYLGVKTFLSQPANSINNPDYLGAKISYFSTFFLTLTNPMTILSFVAMFAGIGTPEDYLSATWLVFGVFIGSACWWFLLSSGIASFRSHLNENYMLYINRLSGCVILAFGLYALTTQLH